MEAGVPEGIEGAKLTGKSEGLGHGVPGGAGSVIIISLRPAGAAGSMFRVSDTCVEEGQDWLVTVIPVPEKETEQLTGKLYPVRRIFTPDTPSAPKFGDADRTVGGFDAEGDIWIRPFPTAWDPSGFVIVKS